MSATNGDKAMQNVYLDNAATSFPKAPGVGEAMLHYVNSVGANINRGSYGAAQAAGLTVLEVRSKLARLFCFPGEDSHVVFQSGATAGLNQLLKGYLQPGDHVVVSSLEHNAMMRPLTELAARGVEFSRIPADENGVTDPMALLPLLRKNTRLVAVSHASNVCGTLFPLEEVAALCCQKGLPLIVDAAQTAGHTPIDFAALHLAALCVPGHKGLLGPQGIGALLLDKHFAARLTPLITGGTGSASDSEVQPHFMPDRFEAGTQNLPGLFGLYAALNYIEEVGVEALEKRERALTALFLEALRSPASRRLPVRIVGKAEATGRVGVVSLDFPDRDNAQVASLLESDYGILTRCGLHCAPNAHKTLGTFPQGTVRFSLGYGTTEQEVLYAAESVERLLCAVQ